MAYDHTVSLLPEANAQIMQMSGGNMPEGYTYTESMLPNAVAPIVEFKGGAGESEDFTEDDILALILYNEDELSKPFEITIGITTYLFDDPTNSDTVTENNKKLLKMLSEKIDYNIIDNETKHNILKILWAHKEKIHECDFDSNFIINPCIISIIYCKKLDIFSLIRGSFLSSK